MLIYTKPQTAMKAGNMHSCISTSHMTGHVCLPGSSDQSGNLD